jgi:tetratricopeptide (TPR) repeat protein
LDSPDSAKDLLSRGEAARRERRMEDARRAFAAASEYYDRHGPAEMRIHALTRRAQIERDTGNYNQAIDFQKEALDLLRSTGGPGLAHTLRHLADMLQDAGQNEEAAPYYAEMMSRYEAAPGTPPLEMANAIRSLAVHAERMGDRDGAKRLWTEARERYAKLDQLFLEMTGRHRNPGMEEATRRLAAL